MKNKYVKISRLFGFSIDEILTLKKNLNIVFEDGKTLDNVPYKLIQVYRVLMDFWTRPDLPKIPLTEDLWIGNFLEEGYFNNDTFLDMYSKYLEKYINTYLKPNYSYELLLGLLRGFYQSAYNLPSKLMKHIGDYVIDVEIQDILEVQFNKQLLDSIMEVYKKPSPDAVNHTYQVLDDVIRHLPDDNTIKLIYLSKMVNRNQLKQLFGSRGYLTDINSQIFNLPMMNSFTIGCRNLYDFVIESRAGAKALHMANKAIPDSEYTARGLQLATMYVEHIEYTDCGNKTYTDFYVRPREIDPVTGKEAYKGDFKNILGKRYLDQDGVEKTITPKDTHLIGTTIKLRNATTCKFLDKKKICIACAGDAAYAIFPHQNLGHYTATFSTQKITQNLLSAKHLTFSADAKPIILPKTLENILAIKDKDKVYLRKQLMSRKKSILKLHIPQEQVIGFMDVLNIKDIRSINLNKVSRLNELILEHGTEKEPVYTPMQLYINNRAGIFTVYFWSYLIKKGYTIDDSGNYVVDLSDWNFNQPIFMYERKEFDFRALGREFKKLLQKRKYYKKDGKKYAEYTPEILAQKVFELINNKLSVNLTPVECTVYPFTAFDINNNDYDLGRNSPNRQLVTLKIAIDYRSIGSSFAWNQLQTKIYDPVLFKTEHKPDHPMDVFFYPQIAMIMED